LLLTVGRERGRDDDDGFIFFFFVEDCAAAIGLVLFFLTIWVDFRTDFFF
jgi:hypothetical protein